ncbi:MAG: 1-acyl-sn-glycerol-3-phosphate acyltransferase [Chthoniobacter sp.]|jgi:1-acyl-sn-glycerol-3-phosphate acyltransferase|nr:1-acyl-sn-glycerol-3-phosphate acyltransferase [Chthoniobacter sp.]
MSASKKTSRWYWFGYNLSKVLARIFFRFRVVHGERIVETGGAILAMNHQSFLDPPLAGICCRRPIHFLARKTLLKWPILGPIFPKLNVVPVDQERADMSALKTVIRLVKSGECTTVFPEGGRTENGELQPAQPGLGLIIAKTLAPVVPMRIFGAYEAFPRGAKRPKMHPITVVVGEPIQFTEEDLIGSGRDLYQKLSERVMERIAALSRPD